MAILFLFLVGIFFNEGNALPRFSLRGGGGGCTGCHVNPTGGDMRNRGGWGFGKNVLHMQTPGRDFEMSNKIGENIQLGLDLRGQALLMMTSKKKGLIFKE